MTSRLSKLLLVAACMSIVMSCSRTPEWTLFYVADQPDVVQQTATSANIVQTEFISGYYDSLMHCQAKGTGMLRLQGSSMPVAQAFVCAQQCKVDDNQQLQCLRQVVGGESDAI